MINLISEYDFQRSRGYTWEEVYQYLLCSQLVPEQLEELKPIILDLYILYDRLELQPQPRQIFQFKQIVFTPTPDFIPLVNVEIHSDNFDIGLWTAKYRAIDKYKINFECLIDELQNAIRIRREELE